MKSSQELLRLTIEKGIESVKSDSGMKPHEIEGSVIGFEACRALDVSTPDAMEKILAVARGKTNAASMDYIDKKISIDDYWKIRYEEIQIEYVYEIMKLAWIQSGFPVESVSARAADRFNEIMSGK